MKLNRRLVLPGLAIIAFFGMISTKSAFAVGLSQEIQDKITYQGVYDCYATNESSGGLAEKISISNLLMSNGAGGVEAFTGSKNAEAIVKQAGFAEEISFSPLDVKKKANITCKSLFSEKTATKVPSTVTNGEQAATILANAKYSPIITNSSNTNNQKCYRYFYNADVDETLWVFMVQTEGTSFSMLGGHTENLCVTSGDGGLVATVSGSVGILKDTDGRITNNTKLVEFEAVSGGVKVKTRKGPHITAVSGWDEKTVYFSGNNESEFFASVGNEIAAKIGPSSANSILNEMVTTNLSPDAIVSKTQDDYFHFYSACEKYEAVANNGGIKCIGESGEISEYSQAFDNTNSQAQIYQKPATTQANMNMAISYFSNKQYVYRAYSSKNTKFSDLDKYNLYQYYINDVLGASEVTCRDDERDTMGVRVKLWWEEKQKYNLYCYPNFSDTVLNKMDSIKLYGVYNDGTFGRVITLRKMIDDLNLLELDSSQAPGGSLPVNGQPGTIDGDACWDSGGFNGMNWVLCPTLYNLKEATTGISGAVDEMMKVDTQWYETGGEANRAWEYMRTIANVLMTIILLAIVFSQLTGYGIDNYGIKKMLPKLVIMAILINLSFLICQLAIDASNIIGKGINNLLQTMASTKMSAGEVISVIFDLLLTGGAALASGSSIVLAGVVAVGSNAPVAWFVLVFALLAVFIGIFIFFLMLGARVIIIVLFSILSPIAFACYILPNTQKIFKNWWKVFSTALVIYPICGAVYGLSAIIRGIVFKDGSGEMHILMALTAALTPVLPYYIMPTLLKNSMNALGSVGGVLNSLGNTLRKGVSGANQTLRSSESYKEAEKTSMRARRLNYANRTIKNLRAKDKALGGTGTGTSLNAKNQRIMATALESRDALESENISAGAKLIMNEFGDNEKGMVNAWKEAYKGNNTARLLALTEALHSKYGVGGIASIGKKMAEVANEGVGADKLKTSLSELSRYTVTNKNFGKDFRVKATDAFKYATTGGEKSFSEFSANNGVTTTYEDVLNQGAAAVERTALAGGFNKMLGENAAEGILASDSQILKNMLSDKDKRAAVEAQAYIDNFEKGKTLQTYIDDNKDSLFNGCYKTNDKGEKVFDYSAAIKVVAGRYEARIKATAPTPAPGTPTPVPAGAAKEGEPFYPNKNEVPTNIGNPENGVDEIPE